MKTSNLFLPLVIVAAPCDSCMAAAPPPKRVSNIALDEAALYYTKAEVQGVLNTNARRGDHPPEIIVIRDRSSTRVPLLILTTKGWDDKKLDANNGKVVKVTGTLQYISVSGRQGVTERKLALSATVIEIITEDD